jgi:hypothetical protein
MTPFVFGLSTAVSTQILSATHLWGIPDWLAAFLMIAGMIFLFGVLPVVVLFGVVFECRRRGGSAKG